MRFKKNKILFIILVNLTLVAFSQQRGNRQGVSQQQSNQQAFSKVTPQNMAQLIMYDKDVVLKKIKVKKTETKAIVVKAISKHNNKINEIKAFNYQTFDNVKSLLTKKRNEAVLSRDFNTMKEAQIEVQEMLKPIKQKVQAEKNALNTTLENVLSEKQYKTWLKYQQSELKKLNPRAENKQQMQQNSPRNRRGQGRNRY